jgi:2-amino-4-hydroxy-6-hydroxymethyldihydropteridine diphosphokinase
MDDVVFIALGSNLGDRDAFLADARARIAALPGVTVLRESSIEETEPLGSVPQGAYLNQMLAARTTLTPPELLASLHDVERALGRERTVRWGPRTIDLDIVKYAHTTWSADDLVVPHPQLPHRPFWHRELAELGDEEIAA